MPGPKGPQYRGEGIGGPGGRGRIEGDEEDVEGHGGAKGPQYRDGGEGIGGPGGRGRLEGDDEDVEGHSMEMRYRSPGSTGE
jgi:hypothetical protein